MNILLYIGYVIACGVISGVTVTVVADRLKYGQWFWEA